jgi:hypothetical protein
VHTTPPLPIKMQYIVLIIAWKQLFRLRTHPFESEVRNVPPTTWISCYKPRVYQPMSRVLSSS